MRISDWSSDVCSPDLAHTVAEVLPGTSVKKVLVTAVGDLLKFPKGAIVNFMLRHVKKQIPAYKIAGAIGFREALALGAKKACPEVSVGLDDIARSEERRVGKECVSTCRSRWSPCHEKKK